MSDSGQYRVLKFTKGRRMIAEAVKQSKYFDHIVGIFECDVTDALEIFEKHEEKTGEKLSFTSWVIKCVAQAASENKVVQTFRKGHSKMIEFQDVDVKSFVEKKIKDRYLPIAYIIRKADKKSFREINDEIRTAQKYDNDQRKREAKIKKRQDFIMKLPGFIRALIWRRIMKNPHLTKKQIGTIGVTAMGMFGKGIVGYAIPKTFHATTVAVGAIVKKPVYIGDNIEPRQILHITVEFDHAVVDGAPAVRFASRLGELLKTAYGLDDFK